MQTNIVLFGAPGSGKGTQAKLIAEKFGFDHVSTGDLFRYEISHKTPLGLKAQEIINRGDLCPDDITLGMLNNHIQKHADSKGFIFDGVPRTIKQLEGLQTTAQLLVFLNQQDFKSILAQNISTYQSAEAGSENDNIVLVACHFKGLYRVRQAVLFR